MNEFFEIYNLSIWLHWVFVAESRGCPSFQRAGLSLQWLLLVQSTGLRLLASVVAVCKLTSCGLRALERKLSICGTRA